MKIWTVVAISCRECNEITVGTFDHSPTQEEKLAVIEECGGMHCISTNILETEIDQKPIVGAAIIEY